MKIEAKRWKFLLVLALLATLQAACGLDSITGADDSDSDSDAAGTNGG